ncbi:hypothetical protein PROPHIGD91-4_32 [Mycobacterium phage prophi91-4]|nr:hypothetical protein PROPHIGD91-4_32 [Mycobacterium phage prophi91-4]
MGRHNTQGTPPNQTNGGETMSAESQVLQAIAELEADQDDIEIVEITCGRN